jgi:hypothetical protein
MSSAFLSVRFEAANFSDQKVTALSDISFVLFFA